MIVPKLGIEDGHILPSVRPTVARPPHSAMRTEADFSGAMLHESLQPEGLMPPMPELPPLLCDEDMRRAFLFSSPEPAKPALPPIVVVASHNLWLIPLLSTWTLGRRGRCMSRLEDAVSSLTVAGAGAPAGGGARVEDDLGQLGVRTRLQWHTGCGDAAPLVLVAIQEAWAVRAGPWTPLLWLWGRLEETILRLFKCPGAHQPFPLAFLANAFLILSALTSLLLFQWIPFVRTVLYDPKPRIAARLAASANLFWSDSSAAAFATVAPTTCPPLLMDGGLLLCANASADASGFVPYPRKGSAEALAQKGEPLPSAQGVASGREACVRLARHWALARKPNPHLSPGAKSSPVCSLPGLPRCVRSVRPSHRPIWVRLISRTLLVQPLLCKAGRFARYLYPLCEKVTTKVPGAYPSVADATRLPPLPPGIQVASGLALALSVLSTPT